MRPLGAGFGNVHFLYVYIFILDKCCQHLGNTFPLNLYTGIGYILPTIEGYMAVGGFLPQALQALVVLDYKLIIDRRTVAYV